MNISHGKTHWTPEELDQLRADIKGTLEGRKLSQAALAREAQVPPSTLSGFLSGNGDADPQPVARKLTAWLETLREREAVNARVMPRPTFVTTNTALQVQGVLRASQALGDLGAVVGPAGVGKSSAARQYAAVNNRVAMVTASTMIASATALMGEFCREVQRDNLNVPSSRATLTKRIRVNVGEGWLFVLDEAQFANLDAIEELRAIHDATGIGLVMMGNPTVLSRLQGNERQASFAQLWSRIGQRVELTGTAADEVEAVIDSMGIFNREVVDLLKAIGAKDNLRTAVMVARQAGLIASGAQEDLAPKHIRPAYRRLGGQLPRAA